MLLRLAPVVAHVFQHVREYLRLGEEIEQGQAEKRPGSVEGAAGQGLQLSELIVIFILDADVKRLRVIGPVMQELVEELRRVGRLVIVGHRIAVVEQQQRGSAGYAVVGVDAESCVFTGHSIDRNKTDEGPLRSQHHRVGLLAEYAGVAVEEDKHTR